MQWLLSLLSPHPDSSAVHAAGRNWRFMHIYGYHATLKIWQIYNDRSLHWVLLLHALNIERLVSSRRWQCVAKDIGRWPIRYTFWDELWQQKVVVVVVSAGYSMQMALIGEIPISTRRWRLLSIYILCKKMGGPYLPLCFNKNNF